MRNKMIKYKYNTGGFLSRSGTASRGFRSDKMLTLTRATNNTQLPRYNNYKCARS